MNCCFYFSSLLCVTTKLKSVLLSISLCVCVCLSVRERLNKLFFNYNFIYRCFCWVQSLWCWQWFTVDFIIFLYPLLTFKIHVLYAKRWFISKILKIHLSRVFFHSKVTTNAICLICTADNVMFILEIIISVKRIANGRQCRRQWWWFNQLNLQLFALYYILFLVPVHLLWSLSIV